MDVFVQQIINGLVLGSSYALVALGLLLVFGVLNIPNFAHGELFMLAALTTGALVTRSGTPYLLAAVAGIVVAAAAGLLMHRGVFKPLEKSPHIAMLVAALALAILLQEVAAKVFGTRPFAVDAPLSGVIEVGGTRIGVFRLVIVGAVILGVALCWYLVHRTAFGRDMRALAQNRDAAIIVGVNVPLVASLVFALAAVLAGLAGALLAGTTVLTPTLGFHPTLVAFSVLIMAGVGNMWGAVIGGFLVGVLEALTAGYIGTSHRTSAIFILLVVFLAIRPQGAFGKEKVL